MKLSLALLLSQALAGVKQLRSGNRDSVLAEDKVSFVNFYADWCRYELFPQSLIISRNP